MAGSCDPRFEHVEEAFEANLAAGLEAGAACAIVVDGRLVVDLWGGVADVATQQPWTRDTLVDCRSATKGLTALCLAMLVDQGRIELDAPVRRYWPELRADPSVREALSHQAGIPIIDDLSPGAILDWDLMAAAIARQEPMWSPGDRHGYHGTSFGWLIGEPVRRVTGLSVPDFLDEHVLDRLDVEGFMGTPRGEHGRMANLVWGRPAHGDAGTPPTGVTGSDPTLAQRMYAPVLPPLAPSMNDPAFRSATIPVTGAAVTARTFAVIYGQLALEGGDLVSSGVARAMGEVQVEGDDAILGVPVSRTLGYELTPSWVADGRPPHCWGSPGGGGVVTFVDPVARVGFAYVNNAIWGGAPGHDPRSAVLTEALYACLS
jgi:CubicO group peptidase (beta-lactamase class C family)